jgi:hypothetical protein
MWRLATWGRRQTGEVSCCLFASDVILMHLCPDCFQGLQASLSAAAPKFLLRCDELLRNEFLELLNKYLLQQL